LIISANKKRAVVETTPGMGTHFIIINQTQVMEVSLKRIQLVNFKKHQHLAIDFQRTTTIEGINRSGKSTIFDAWLWLLFGKNAMGVSEFTIKPTDSTGREIQKTEVEVTADLLVDYKPVTLRKVYKEKWTKKRGEPIAVYTGNENLYYWNDVPMSEAEYKTKISGMISENTFRMVTSTSYFNSMKWQDRRQTLLSVVGGISDRDVAGSNADFNALMDAMAGKTFAEYKAEISSKKKKLKDELENIPLRIDEVNRGMPKIQAWDELKAEIATSEARIAEIDKAFTDQLSAQNERNTGIRDLNNTVHKLKLELQQAENDIKNKFANDLTTAESAIKQLKFKMSTKQAEYQQTVSAYRQAGKDLLKFKGIMDSTRADWEAENKKVFVDDSVFVFEEGQCICPTCHQQLPADDVAERKAKLKKSFDENKEREEKTFNEKKVVLLNKYRTEGMQAKYDKEQTETRAAELKAAGESLQVEIEQLNTEIQVKEFEFSRLKDNSAREVAVLLENSEVLADLKSRTSATLQAIQAKENSTTVDRDPVLIKEKANLQQVINDCRRALSDEQTIIRNTQRIAELNAQQTDFAQQLMEYEGKEFTMLEFEKAKMDILETRINGMFKVVSFRLFDRQVNGAEVPCCDTLCNGVPYPDANTEFKVNAGLDIISVISRANNISAPIFIDNRESTTSIIDTDAQIINLVVNPYKKELEVTYE
jgi:exonuclease SbcC